MSEEKNKVGHPLKFKRDELIEKIQQFFDLVKEGVEAPSVVGLACHLETNKQTLLNYQKKDEFSDIIIQAKQQIEKLFTIAAYKGDIPPAIFIFTAKNHYEYEDNSKLDTTQTIVWADADDKQL